MSEDFAFCMLCGGNDATPREHTLDCLMSIDRAQRIEDAARTLLKRPTSERARKALQSTLDISLRIDDTMSDSEK